MLKITEKDKSTLNYLLKGVSVRVDLLNTQFDDVILRNILKDWYIELEKEMKKLELI